MEFAKTKTDGTNVAALSVARFMHARPLPNDGSLWVEDLQNWKSKMVIESVGNVDRQSQQRDI